MQQGVHTKALLDCVLVWIPPVFGYWQFQAKQCSWCIHHESLSKNYQCTLAQKTIAGCVTPQSLDVFFVLEMCLTKEQFHLIFPCKTYLWHFGAIENMAKQPLDISETQALCQDDIFKSTCLTLCDICFCTSSCLVRLIPAAHCFWPLLQPFPCDQTCRLRRWEGRSFQLPWEKFRID